MRKDSLSDKACIMIVDDDSAIRALLRIILHKHFEIREASNGIEALQKLQEGTLPDLLILDLEMPQMDGYELLRQLKASGFFQGIPAVVLSGNNDEAYRERCLRLGADAFLPKPFDPRQIFQIVAEQLSARIINWTR